MIQRGGIFLLALAFSMFFMLPTANADDIELMTVETDIFVPEDIVSIQVPDYVYVGNITTTNSKLETDDIILDINNTGNVDIIVTPELADEGETIFSYLYFARTTSDPYRRIGDWSLNISKPSSEGGVRKQSFHLKLDLDEYPGDFTDSIFNHKADVRFVAVADD